MESIILLGILLFLILLGAPIGFILILIPFVYILFTDAVPLILIPSQMFNAIDSVPLTAIAFFMLTGELMTSATITDRLVALSKSLIGRVRGGLAQVNVLVSMFFAGMNGSVVADTATVGALVLPAMKKAGYPPAFSAAVTGVSSTIGGIIPPSIMMIVLANSTELSIASLFAAGIIPGVLIGVVIMIINHYFAIKYNFERSDEPFSIRRAGKELYRSSFALLIPVVLVGSVMGGVASVVEAGAITAMVALFTGVFVYRTIKWKDCTGAFRRAFRNSAMVFIIIAASGPFSWLLTSLGAIGELENWLLSLTGSPIIFILAVILFIFLLGTVMDSAVNIIIVGPVLVNVMAQAGFPEIQAAIVVIVGFLIGSVTPPVGVAFFTAATIAEVRLEKVAEYVFDESMKVVGADKSKMTVIQMDPEEGAAALVSGDVSMACLFGGNSIKAALTVGTRLLTVQAARDAGIKGIDITSVTDKFMKENPGMLRTFIEVTHEANARYAAGKSDMNVIAKDAEMKLGDMKETLGGFVFLNAADTKKSMESGGNLDGFLKGMGTPNGAVDTSFLPL